LGGNRSAVIERLLRRADRDEALARLKESTTVYYDSLTAGERTDAEAISLASSAAARRLAFDDLRLTGRRRWRTG
jgi:hypothetical protein